MPGSPTQELEGPASAECSVHRLAELLELALAAHVDPAGEALQRVGFALLGRLGGLLLQRRQHLLARLRGLAGPVLGTLGEQAEDDPVEPLGHLGLCREGGTGSACRCWEMIETASSPGNGGWPVSIS